jgi:ketosteroid isomerase-like protein
MSEENIEVVRRALEIGSKLRYPAPDYAELEQLIHPDAHIDLSAREVNPATYEGHEGGRQMFRELFEIWSEFSIEPVELLSAEDGRVLAICTMRGRGRSSGVVVEMQVYNVYTVRSGRIVQFTSYRDKSTALEAAGLSQ